MAYRGKTCRRRRSLETAKRGANLPSEMAYRGKLHASERRSLKRSLEPATAREMSLGCGKSPQVGTCHP